MIDFDSMEREKREAYIRGEVSKFASGERMRRAKECRAYYATENPDISSRKKCYAAVDADTGNAYAKENRFAANEKISSSFFRDITDSKVQYLAGEGADVTASDEAQAAPVQQVGDALGKQLKRIGQECLTDALVYRSGFAYLQVIDGAIKLSNVPYMEVVPYYDRTGKLETVLRYYKRGGVEHAEYHTKDKVWYFERDPKNRDARGWRETGEEWQIRTVTVYGSGEIVDSGGKGWAVLPWFEMHHNNDHTSSLTNAAKSMIQCYDVTISDFTNNLIDVQDVFVSVKDGYGSGMEFGEQLELLRNFKYTEGDTSVNTVDIPYAAREVLLNLMKADIYAALRGVDVGRISGGQLTNTAIRALYSDIDLWADQAEWHIADWVESIYKTVAGYMGVSLPPINVKLTRRAIFNEIEQMDALARQKGVISDLTIYENHPLVTDAQQEIVRVQSGELDAAYSEGLAG